MTTAVLAGLTLGTAKSNDVVVHANATPVATQTVSQQTTTPASQATETKSAVDKTSDQISQVKDELNKVQQANEANKDFQKTTDTNKAADQDQQIVNNHKAAKQTVKDAQNVQATAKQDVDDAQAAVKQAQENVNKTSNDLNDAQAAQKAAQESYDDNQNAITDADNDMRNNIKPAKDKADKAYNDQLAYQKQLENGLSQFQGDLENKKEAEKAAQTKVDNTNNAITDADNDMRNNIKPAKDAADQAYNDAINDQDVKYFDAKDAAKADQAAATKADDQAAKSANAANNLKQAAQDAVTSAQATLEAPNHQLRRDMSAWRHNRSHENALAVNKSKRAVQVAEDALAAAKHNLDNMNNYDVLKQAQVTDQAATKALEDANAAVAEDNSEWNQEAQAAAQASTYTFRASGNQDIIVELGHQTQTTSREKSVTRQIIITDPTGHTKITTQKATLNQTGMLDLVTQQTNWGDWTTGR